MAAALGSGLATPEQLNSPQMPLSAQADVFGVTYGGELAAAALLLYLLFARVGPKSGIQWRWRDPLVGAGLLLLAAPLYIAGSMLVQFIAQQVDPGSVEVIAHDTLRQMLNERGTPWFWGMCAAVVIGAPAAEEVIFRLLVQSAVLRWTKSAWAAIGVTGVLFGAVHLGSVPWYAAIVLGLVGVILGIAFERTKRIGVPIVMHALFNAIQIAASLLIFPPGSGTSPV
jgi:membrane protease YdiL (CAAX protease family)